MQYVCITKQATNNQLPDSLHDGYWILGYLLRSPRVGESVQVARTVRNGVEADGMFTTSAVTKVVDTEDGYYFSTENSDYMLEFVDGPERA